MKITDPATWEKAKDVIADALKRSPSEREAFVREHCPDPALRAEIDAMLKQYEDDPDFLENPAHLVDEVDELADLQPGTHVGPYVLVDRLGRGGMGQVFLGSDPRLHRKVALKCLFATRSQADDRRSGILHEARASARINHSNVATVHDVIEHDGRAFIVMEYVEGESLSARLKRERLPIDRVVAIGRQLASALTAAHATGIIHRDLKPGNIQLAVDGSVKVLDFGVAKALAMLSSTGRPTTATKFEAHGALVGTPGYMSPEQILGRDVDERSDIFSLGIVLYEMTTGRRPFTSTDPLDLVLRLGKRSVQADLQAASVPPDVAEVIAKALDVDARQRFQTAAEVEAEFVRIERDLDLSAHGQKRRMEGRPWTWIALRALAFLICLPFVIGFLGFVTTTAFNNTFVRTGNWAVFGLESPAAYIVWGFRSIVPPAIWMTLFTLIFLSVRHALRLASLFGPIARLRASGHVTLGRIKAALDLDDPAGLAQALATLAMLSVAVVIWVYYDLIHAWLGTFISLSSPESLAPLRPDNEARNWYRITLDFLLLIFGIGLFRVVRLRRRQARRHGAGGLVFLSGVILILVLLNHAPYRIFYGDRFERLEINGFRCYDIGQHDDELLVYCPDTDPPRNRVIKRDDPTLNRLGIVESVFTPAPGSRSGS